MYMHKVINLLKSYDNIHGMTYTTKIMLSDIAKIKTGHFDNINDYYLENFLKGIAKITSTKWQKAIAKIC